MANFTMVKDTTNNIWIATRDVVDAGTTTDILTTQNTFVDANISIKVNTPTASGQALNITNQGSTNITVGTVSGGYYPLTTSLTGTLTVSNAGWIATSGLQATDTSVTVGRIAQSTLKNGSTTINSGTTIVPNVSSSQTINISAGYNSARTVVIAPMNSGTSAAATITATAAATKPTIAYSAAAINDKVQVEVTATTATPGSGVKFYTSVKATAPETKLTTITKTIDTAGYLGTNSQITANSDNIKATATTGDTYYLPLATGNVTITGSKKATAPTAAINTTATNNSKTRLDTNNGLSITTGNVSSPYFIAVNLTAPATTITLTKTVTAGYIGSTEEVTGNSVSTSANSDAKYYINIPQSTLSAGTGSVNASSGTISLGTKSTSQPTTDFFITVTGSGKTTANGSGWIANGTEGTSNTATAYYSIPTASFIRVNNKIKTNAEGYVLNDVEVGTVPYGTISTGATANSGYTNLTGNNYIVPANGYLYIGAGYYDNSQISLATLIPDDTNYENAGTDKIRAGFEAYDTNGNKLIGTIPTYNGEYTAG